MRNDYIKNYLKRGGLITLLLAHSFAIIQGQSYDEIITNIESQLQEYTLQDTHKVKLLNDLSYAYRRNDPEKIESFAKEALQLSVQLNYDKGKGIAYKNLAIAEYKSSGSTATIIAYYEEAISWSKKANDYYTQVAVLNNLGLTYHNKLAYDKSIGAFQETLDLHKKHLPENRLKLLILGNFGDVYLRLEDYQKAIEYYDELTQAAIRLKDEKTKILNTETQALLLFKLKKPAEAIKLIETNLPKLKDFGDYQSVVRAQIILSDILLDKKEFQAAHKVLNEAQATIQQYNLKVEQCGLFLNLSKIYLAESKTVAAKEIGNEALTCTEENPDASFRLMTAKHLIRVYHANNDAKGAAILFTLYNDLQKEYADAQKQKAYIKTELAYKVKHKEAENALLLAKQRESEATIQSQKIFNTSLLAAVICSLFLVGLAVRAYFLKQKQNKILDKKVLKRTAELNASNEKLVKSNKKLAQSNQELEKFVYIASHDLKQPLCTVVNFAKLLTKEVAYSPNPESKLYLNHILDSGGRMMNLIEDVLEFSKVDKKHQQLEVIDLNQLVAEVKKLLAASLTKKNAAINIINPLPSIKYDRTQLLIVFKNLIENGIIYNTSTTPTVRISSQQENGFIKVSFQDNGIGIDEQYHHKLFQMFSRLQNHKDYKGTGLGLSLCKRIADSMRGEIGIERQSVSGSLFYFGIPIAMVVASDVTVEELSQV
ncbi:MAG: ATP-binding protein [Saprospiraceae bacterium]